MLVTMSEILNKAKAEHYAVAAPNVANEDTVRAALSAAVECSAPIILDINNTGQEPESVYSFGKIARMLAEEVSIPVAINLDHGADYETAIIAIRAGYTSVMIDRSKDSFEENVRQTARVVEVAKICNVSVEAELGHVGIAAMEDVSERDSNLTDPTKAEEFVKRTGIDCLAIAIGTAHGLYKGEPKIDFVRLAQLVEAVNVPLVLHGGSGTGAENLRRACREGISKVNLATDVFLCGFEAMKADEASGKHPPFPGWWYISMMHGFKAKLVEYMKIFGQCNKA